MSTPSSCKISLALDWTPNTNHSGFFVANARGLYKTAGIEVEFLSPLDNNYEQTPRMRVESGDAHFGELLPCRLLHTHILYLPLSLSLSLSLEREKEGERRRWTSDVLFRGLTGA
jgi:hypothetical protein